MVEVVGGGNQNYIFHKYLHLEFIWLNEEFAENPQLIIDGFGSSRKGVS